MNNKHEHYYNMWVYWVDVITAGEWERRGKTEKEAQAMEDKYFRLVQA